MVPGAGLEPARCCHRGILSPLRLPISPPGHIQEWSLTCCLHGRLVVPVIVYGGAGRNRTGVDGFAIRCITTLPPRHNNA